jgi:nitrite reductase (cytochrome c-552)
LRDRALEALVDLIEDLETSATRDTPESQLSEARRHQRRGQFYLDFVESENSNGFHAPQEAARILGEAIDQFRRGQMALRPLRGEGPGGS